MKISPMDIQRQTFARRLRGLDPEEVRTYLALVAEEVAALQHERDDLARQLQHIKVLLEEHRERETILKNTLLTAQKLSEDIRDNARKQSESVVREAELQADRLIELAQSAGPRSGEIDPRPALAPHGYSHGCAGPDHAALPSARSPGRGRARGQPALPPPA